MAFHVGVATVQRHKEKDSVSFAVILENHAITEESGGVPVFHRIYIPGFHAWRNPQGGAITIRTGPIEMSDAMKQSIIACLTHMPEVHKVLKIGEERIAQHLKQVVSTTKSSKLFRVA